MNLLREWLKWRKVKKELENEIKKQGVLAVARTFNTDKEQSEFITRYYLGDLRKWK
jgi:hypothetical protein